MLLLEVIVDLATNYEIYTKIELKVMKSGIICIKYCPK